MSCLNLRYCVIAFAAAVGLASVPAAAQMQTVDPNAAIGGNGYATTVPAAPPGTAAAPAPASAPRGSIAYPAEAPVAPAAADADAPATTTAVPATPAGVAPIASTYQQDDVLAAAEGVFGRGAEGLAKIVENILKDQGEPNAYIGGREAGGAFAIGVRYGSGTMTHKVEGTRPVFWTGPSVGFDVGANGSKTFVLVYNLYDSQELFRRFPAAEGAAYFVGGFTASYLRRGDVVLIPIRLGVGWRLGANVGYMRFSEKSKILPF
ncbi:DUF1134 domain-containing protein [Sphingomonas sp. 1P06PA]|uniref:DUF1134 domain-containing protein n=1 Tax=Sphingomonas sp. 1P06PA TaxID=554121 RepID=UPI0039A6531B